jgi:hypothetical protein
MRTIVRTVAAATALTLGVLATPTAHAAHATKPPWRVTIKASTTTTTVGHKIWLTGKVAKSAAGKLVVLQEKAASGKPWNDQRNASVHADGTYRTWDTPTANHHRLYRVVMPATKKHAKGISKSVGVDVYTWVPMTSLGAVNDADLDPVSSVSINAVVFPSSLEASVFHYTGAPTTQSVEFNLNHKCTKFRGTFGLSDDSETGGQASVQASADGTSWFNQSFTVGQSAHDVEAFATPPLKVHLETASLVDGADGLGAVGTPEVFCTQ